MSESKTPRVDAELAKCYFPPFGFVNFARALELELNEALKQTNNQSERINELVKICEEWRTDYTKQSAQLAAAQAELNEVRSKLVHEWNQDETPSFRAGGQPPHELEELVTAERCNQLVSLITDARSQLTTAQQEKHQQQIQFLELYKLMPEIENQYVDRLYYHLANYLQRYHLQQQEIAELKNILNEIYKEHCATMREGQETGHSDGLWLTPSLSMSVRKAIESTTKGTKE